MDRIKKGFFKGDDDDQVKSMIETVRHGQCDYTIWKDWLVMGQYDDGELQEITVARIVRHIDLA